MKEQYILEKEYVRRGTLNTGFFPFLFEYFKDNAIRPDIIGSQAEFDYAFTLYLNTPIMVRDEIYYPIEDLYKSMNKIFNHLDKKYGIQ